MVRKLTVNQKVNGVGAQGKGKMNKTRSLMNSMGGNSEVTKWETRSRQEYIIQNT